MELMGHINHKNCINIIDWFYTQDEKELIWQNMVMPFYPYSLGSLIYKQKVDMSVPQVKRLAKQVLHQFVKSTSITLF